MYLDFSPVPEIQAEQVLVIEPTDNNVDEVMEMATGASSVDGDETVFWVVFAEDPKRVWDMTERVLRREIAKRAKGA